MIVWSFQGRACLCREQWDCLYFSFLLPLPFLLLLIIILARISVLGSDPYHTPNPGVLGAEDGGWDSSLEVLCIMASDAMAVGFRYVSPDILKA